MHFGGIEQPALRTAASTRAVTSKVAGPSLRPTLRGGASDVVAQLEQPARGSLTALQAAASTAEASSPATTKRLTPENAMEMIDAVDVFIFDCDGVIWKGATAHRSQILDACRRALGLKLTRGAGDTLIPGVEAILDKLRELGKKVFFVTNNSTKSRKGYKAKFDSLGLNVSPTQALVTSNKFLCSGFWLYVSAFVEPEVKRIGFVARLSRNPFLVLIEQVSKEASVTKMTTFRRR